MSFLGFTYMHELLQTDLTTKPKKQVISLEFKNLHCNCNAQSNVDGLCIYNKECRMNCIVYEVQCNVCKTVYVNNTLQFYEKEWLGIIQMSNTL